MTSKLCSVHFHWVTTFPTFSIKCCQWRVRALKFLAQHPFTTINSQSHRWPCWSLVVIWWSVDWIQVTWNSFNRNFQSRFADKLERKQIKMTHLHTAKIWLQYMDTVCLLKNFIHAERTGNWQLHLQSIFNMLPSFAAAGRRMYSKSAHIYLCTTNDQTARNTPWSTQHFSVPKTHHKKKAVNRRQVYQPIFLLWQLLWRAWSQLGVWQEGEGLDSHDKSAGS